jgi:SAM-dependent methyltransferase
VARDDRRVEYLMAGQTSELERLRVQSLAWEPAGRTVLDQLGDGRGQRVLDVGCGALGWLGILSEWVGPEGEVVGIDNEPAMIEAAQSLGLPNVRVLVDDLFDNQLEPGSFDLVHARFVLTPVGRHEEQLDVYTRLAKTGAGLVLEDPDSSSWRLQPEGAATAVLIEGIRMAFKASGVDFDTGRYLPDLLLGRGIEPHVSAHVLALAPDHPYLRVPLQFAESLEPRLRELLGDDLPELIEAARKEIDDPERWGTSFTVVQAWGRLP